MANAIQMISVNEFRLSSRGNEMTLKRTANGWEMFTVNAAVRAWNRGYAVPKYFDSLKAVEMSYKSWVGITALVD